jgi:hypothetical protein
MIGCIEAGEDFPGGDDSSLIGALAPGAEGPVAPAVTAVAEGKTGAAASPRTIRLSVE